MLKLVMLGCFNLAILHTAYAENKALSPFTIPTFGFANQAESTKNNLKSARDLVDLQDYNKALIYYKKQLELEPNNVDLLIEAARVNNWLGNHEEAISLLSRAITLAPARRFDILRPLAWQYIAISQPQQAIIYFNQYLSKYPKDIPALNGLAEANSRINKTNLAIAREYADKKEYSAALIYFKKQLETQPNNSDLIIEIAQTYDDYRKPDESIKYINRLIEVAPQRRIEIIRLLGWQYLALKKPQLAKPLFEEYLLKFPNDTNARQGLSQAQEQLKEATTSIPSSDNLKIARSYFDKKEYAMALIYYKKQLSLEPSNADLLFEIAKVYDDFKKPKEAIEYINKFLQVAPKRRLDIIRLLAWQYINLKNLQAAKEMLSEYLAKYPKDKDAEHALNYLAQIQAVPAQEESPELIKARKYKEVGDFKRALYYYSKVLHKNPKNIDLLIEIAKVHDDAGESRKAIALLDKVMALQPSKRDDLLMLLAWQYHNIKENNKAISLFEEYAKKHIQDPEPLLAIAQVYEDLDKKYRAYAYYLAAQAVAPSNLKAQLGEAKVLLNLTLYTDAKKKYETILKTHPNNKEVLIQIANLHKELGLYSIALKEYATLMKKYPKEEDLKVAYARMQYWSGYDDTALKTLKDAKTQDAKDLANTIRSDFGKSISADYNNFFDTDRVHIQAANLSAQFHMPDSTVTINPTYRIANVSQLGFSFPTNMALVSVSGRIGDFGSKWGPVWPFFALGGRKYSNLNEYDALFFNQFLEVNDSLFPGYEWNSIAWATGFKWIPQDLLKVYVSANNQTIENIRSIRNKVLYSAATFGFDYNFYPPAVFTLEASSGQFDDGNTRIGVANKININIFNGSGFSIGVNDYYFNDSKPEINRGYYNPRNYYQGMGFLALTRRFWGCEWNISGQLGAFMENPGGPGSVYEVDSYVERSFKKFGAVRAYYSQGHSYPNTENGSGYGVKNFGITYSLHFDQTINPGAVTTFNFVNNRGAAR